MEPGGSAGGADIGTQGDCGGQAPNQVSVCRHLQIFTSSLSLGLLVIVVE